MSFNYENSDENNNQLNHVNKWKESKAIISTFQIQMNEICYLLGLDLNGIFYIWNLFVSLH